MAAHFDLIIRNGTCVLPWGEVATDIGVRDGRIAAFGVDAAASADTVVDARHLHVLPGLIDAHVHLRDPGDASVESIPTGTKAAVLGGLACVFDMPNTKPSVTNAEMVGWKQGYIPGRAWCDMGFYVGASKQNIADLAALELEAGVSGVKVFAGSSTGDLLVEDDASIEAVLRSGRRCVSFHSEDEYRLRERRAQFGVGDPCTCHPQWRDAECAEMGTGRILKLARKTGRAAHILHVTTAGEMDMLRTHRDVGSCEVLANHLTLAGPECYERLGNYAVMNPPIREGWQREALWRALGEGIVDVVSSDHAPHSREAKERPWPTCSSGMTGIQTIAPLMLDHVNAGRLSLTRLADVMCAGPARVYGAIGKGRLAAGYDADFTIVDMRQRRRITRDWIATPAGWTPYDGVEVTGWPKLTIVRGNIVMREDEVLGTPSGKLLAFR